MREKGSAPPQTAQGANRLPSQLRLEIGGTGRRKNERPSGLQIRVMKSESVTGKNPTNRGVPNTEMVLRVPSCVEKLPFPPAPLECFAVRHFPHSGSRDRI